MSKALIEKAFEKFMLDKFGIEAKNIDIKAWNIYKDNFDYAWNKGATWQREQLIQELREWIDKRTKKAMKKAGVSHRKDIIVCYFDDIPTKTLLAKLDLLEGEGYERI
jgi:hypothetical protein